jgi:DNA-directed RNA polymerase specialized sigma24 family protein
MEVGGITTRVFGSAVSTAREAREPRVLTQHAFARLLEWLDDGVDSGGETYLQMRRRLVSYFDRRNRPFPDDLADDTLTRVAWRLEEEGTIVVRPPARYCYMTARFVLLEDTRRREHTNISLNGPRSVETFRFAATRVEMDESLARCEQRLDCLDRCLQQLTPEQRELIVDYYRDERKAKIDRRRDLAARLGILMNALATRACRIRDTLEACVERCCQG